MKTDARPGLEGKTDAEQSEVAGDGTCCSADQPDLMGDREQAAKQPRYC